LASSGRGNVITFYVYFELRAEKKAIACVHFGRENKKTTNAKKADVIQWFNSFTILLLLIFFRCDQPRGLVVRVSAY